MVLTACWVTRTELGLGNLQLHSGDFRIEGHQGIEFGRKTWKKQMVDSVYADGEYPIRQARRNGQIGLVVQVRGGNQPAIGTNLGVLMAAFDQFEYEVHATLDGMTYAWTCYAAEADAGSVDDRFAGLRLPVILSIPRHPTPVAGPF